jgi:hypothetical protein
MRLLVCLGCAAIALSAAGQPPDKEPPPHDTVIESLFGDASAVPPEFGADALIRLSMSSRVPTAWRRELLDEAFFRAYGAQEQFRRRAGEPLSPNTRQGADLLSYATPLTRVSLQVRVVELMRFVDPRRARELFEWIEVNLGRDACEDPLVPDVDEYYSVLSTIARTTFGRDRGAALTFLELYRWRAHLPSEMPAVARAMNSFRPSEDEAIYLEGFYRFLLDTSTSDARGFSASVPDIVTRMAEMQVAHHKLDIRGWFVMDTLRYYLAAQLKAPRCVDSTIEMVTPSLFNSAVKRIGGDQDVKSLEAELVLPTLQGSARVDQYWTTPDAGPLHDAASALWGPGKAPLALRVRQTQEWRNQADLLLTQLDRWAGRREASERDYFYQKALLFEVLMELVPPGALRSKTIRTYVDFLRLADTDRSRRSLWFAFVSRLIEISRSTDRREILQTMEDTHQPVLYLYARMERLLPAR